MDQRVFTSFEHCSRSEVRKGGSTVETLRDHRQGARKYARFCVRGVAGSRLKLPASRCRNMDDASVVR